MFDPTPQALTAKAEHLPALRATHPSVNGPALLRLADEIETPTRGLGFNLQIWNMPSGAGVHDREDRNFCGAICCIGGTAEAMLGLRRFHDLLPTHPTVARLLGLTAEQVDALFYPVNGNVYAEVYQATRFQAAAVVRHLAYTGQVDWTVAEARSA